MRHTHTHTPHLQQNLCAYRKILATRNFTDKFNRKWNGKIAPKSLSHHYSHTHTPSPSSSMNDDMLFFIPRFGYCHTMPNPNRIHKMNEFLESLECEKERRKKNNTRDNFKCIFFICVWDFCLTIFLFFVDNQKRVRYEENTCHLTSQWMGYEFTRVFYVQCSIFNTSRFRFHLYACFFVSSFYFFFFISSLILACEPWNILRDEKERENIMFIIMVNEIHVCSRKSLRYNLSINSFHWRARENWTQRMYCLS